jgi:hypothetical protein
MKMVINTPSPSSTAVKPFIRPCYKKENFKEGNCIKR